MTGSPKIVWGIVRKITRKTIRGKGPIGVCAALFLAVVFPFVAAMAQNDSSAGTASPVPALKPTPSLKTFSPETLKTARAIFKDINGERWKAAHRKAAQSGDSLLGSLVRWFDLMREGAHGFEKITTFIETHPNWPSCALSPAAPRKP